MCLPEGAEGLAALSGTAPKRQRTPRYPSHRCSPKRELPAGIGTALTGPFIRRIPSALAPAGASSAGQLSPRLRSALPSPFVSAQGRPRRQGTAVASGASRAPGPGLFSPSPRRDRSAAALTYRCGPSPYSCRRRGSPRASSPPLPPGTPPPIGPSPPPLRRSNRTAAFRAYAPRKPPS